jgi:2-C-methyl-D-erythritol 2,4-cyclodiphosphate synthase
MRIGHGYDVHRFTEGAFITLGGVQIPHKFGLLAHSDGDVLLHALADALLGAAALKMAPHIERMRELIAADLRVELDQVNVKATTTEKLGFTGREEGIAVHAVALLVSL